MTLDRSFHLIRLKPYYKRVSGFLNNISQCNNVMDDSKTMTTSVIPKPGITAAMLWSCDSYLLLLSVFVPVLTR